MTSQVRIRITASTPRSCRITLFNSSCFSQTSFFRLAYGSTRSDTSGCSGVIWATDSATGFSARVSQYSRSPSRSAQVGKSCVRIKVLQWGASRIVGVGVEKSLRVGRRALRWVSIESSEYRLDFRRKSMVNLSLGAGRLRERRLRNRDCTSQDDCVEADCGGAGKGCWRRWWVRYGPRCHCGWMMTKGRKSALPRGTRAQIGPILR